MVEIVFDSTDCRFLQKRTDVVNVNSLRIRDKKRTESANSVDLDEVAHHEPPHLDLHCMPSCL